MPTFTPVKTILHEHGADSDTRNGSIKTSLPRRLDYTLKELLLLPRAEQDEIIFLQASLAATDYIADLALHPADRDLTAFESLNDSDGVHDEGEELVVRKQ